MAEEPSTDYERALDRAGADCSMHECWNPIRAIVLNPWGLEVGVCETCVQRYGFIVLRWLGD